MKYFWYSVFMVSIILLNGEASAQYNFNKYMIRHSFPTSKLDSLKTNYLLDSTVIKSQDSWNNLKCVYNYDEKGMLSYYDAFSNIAGRTSFYYDTLGNITQITGPDSRETNFYDEHNNNIYQLFERPGTAQTWVPYMLDSLFYDTSGIVNKEKDYYWLNLWSATGQTFYYYNSGLLDSVLFGGTNGTQWYNDVYCKFYYNEFASPDSAIWKMWRDTAWIDYLDCTYKYDNAGNLISGLITDLSGRTYDTRFTYSYNKNNCFYYGNNEIKLNGIWTPGDETFFTSRQDIFQPDVFGTVSNCFFSFSLPGTELYVYYKLNPRAISSVKGNNNNNPDQFNLYQNYPNPFNPSTTIKYSIPTNHHVILKVYDMLGREVQTLVNEEKQMGNYEITFDGHNLASGIYIYRITAGTSTSARKMQFIK